MIRRSLITGGRPKANSDLNFGLSAQCGYSARAGDIRFRGNNGHQDLTRFLKQVPASQWSGLAEIANLILPCILRHDSTQQSAQKIGAGNDAFLFAPDQDQIVVDDVIFRMFRLHLHAIDHAA